MASTLMRATRLAQVISVLGNQRDLETTVERIAIEVGELFFADMAVLILQSEAGLTVPGFWGIAAADLPTEPFALPAVEQAFGRDSVRIGPAGDVPLPKWLEPYSPRHVAWARLLVGEKSGRSRSRVPMRPSCGLSPTGSRWRWRTACCTKA
jgi:hypothetical protein